MNAASSSVIWGLLRGPRRMAPTASKTSPRAPRREAMQINAEGSARTIAAALVGLVACIAARRVLAARRRRQWAHEAADIPVQGVRP